MTITSFSTLDEVREALKEVRKNLEGKRIIYDPATRLVGMPPSVNGLWPECQELTLRAFCLVRSKADWVTVKDLCVRSEATVFLYDLLDQASDTDNEKPPEAGS